MVASSPAISFWGTGQPKWQSRNTPSKQWLSMKRKFCQVGNLTYAILNLPVLIPNTKYLIPFLLVAIHYPLYFEMIWCAENCCAPYWCCQVGNLTYVIFTNLVFLIPNTQYLVPITFSLHLLPPPFAHFLSSGIMYTCDWSCVWSISGWMLGDLQIN